MFHAIRNALAVVHQDDDVAMVLGADRAGSLLEVGVVDIDDDDAIVIHVMPMRRKYERFL